MLLRFLSQRNMCSSHSASRSPRHANSLQIRLTMCQTGDISLPLRMAHRHPALIYANYNPSHRPSHLSVDLIHGRDFIIRILFDLYSYDGLLTEGKNLLQFLCIELLVNDGNCKLALFILIGQRNICMSFIVFVLTRLFSFHLSN